MEDIPLYSGATNVDTEKVWRSEWSHTSYEVTAPREEVIAFYKTILPKKGWTITGEANDPTLNDAGLGCRWVDDTGVLPYHREMTIDVTGGVEGEFVGRTFVDISLKRVPDYEKVPVYPGAQSVETNKEAISAGSDDANYVTRFVTHAKPEEIGAYYKQALQQQGYQFDQDSLDIPKGYSFRFEDGGPHGRRVIVVNVVTEFQGDNQTRVTIEVGASNARLSDSEVTK
ncbi:MAG TPA: hypothetical protein VEX13_17170 [Chloroflexia bacterium]|nr:hypothetical protein [Chloroflexia bacterium]